MVIVTVDSHAAVIDFGDIRAVVSVEPDEFHNETPWKGCDGYKHELRAPRSDVEAESKACFYHDGRQQIIILEFNSGLYQWLRDNGASRQSAREFVALDRQKTIEQLKEWYTEGWEWWQVSCEFRGASASVCGVDDYEYADGASADDIADEVASELVSSGYTVTGRPDRRAAYRDGRKRTLRSRHLIGTWS
jgi:hypothetical protein